MLEARRQQIALGLANAEKIKAELAQDRGAAAGSAGAGARRRRSTDREDARAAAARVEAQETQKAVAAAEQIWRRRTRPPNAEHARMLAELRREVGRLVVQTTAAVTGKVLTPTISAAWPRKRPGSWRA